ncbi:MAG: LEA type 2 family protein [Myxococcales bacterium]|jgi:LEA14-like dessication related protein
MRTRGVLAGLALVMAFGSTGCAFQKPSLKFKSVQVKDVDLEGATLNLVYTLKNPNPVGLNLASVAYALEVEGHHVVSGRPPNGLSVRQNAYTDLVFPARIKFREIVPAVQVFLTKDKANYRASGEIGVKTPIGIVKLPLSYAASFEVPKIPDFKFQTPAIHNLSLTGARIVFPIKITNKNSFPLPLDGFSAAFSIAGVRVGKSSAQLPKVFEGNETKVVQMPIDIDFASAGMAVANAIRTKRAHVKLDGALNAGNLSLPISLSENLSFR